MIISNILDVLFFFVTKLKQKKKKKPTKPTKDNQDKFF